MGNEIGSLDGSSKMLTGAPSMADMSGSLGGKSSQSSAPWANASASAEDNEGAAVDPLQKRNGVSVGDRFVTWHSSRKNDVSYVEGKVIEVKRKHGKKMVVLEFKAELDIEGLRASIERAQQALHVEKQWADKLESLGLTKNSDVELWVPEIQPLAALSRPRVGSGLSSHLDSPRRRRRRNGDDSGDGDGGSGSLSADLDASDLPSPSFASAVHGDQLTTSPGLFDGDDSVVNVSSSSSDADAAETDDGRKASSPHEVVSASSPRILSDSESGEEFEEPRDLTVISEEEMPGELVKYKVVDVDISWHFHDAEVDLHIAKIGKDGKTGPVEVLPFKEVRAMLENAHEARALLDREIENVRIREGISVGSKVDLWIESADANVRAIITGIGT